MKAPATECVTIAKCMTQLYCVISEYGAHAQCAECFRQLTVSVCDRNRTIFVRSDFVGLMPVL